MRRRTSSPAPAGSASSVHGRVGWTASTQGSGAVIHPTNSPPVTSFLPPSNGARRRKKIFKTEDKSRHPAPIAGYKRRATPLSLTSSPPRATYYTLITAIPSPYRTTRVCDPPLHAVEPLFRLVSLLPSPRSAPAAGGYKDEDHGAELHGGGAGGGDAADAAVERQPGPGRAAVPHAQRLLLPARRRRRRRRRLLLRCGADAPGAGGGAGALLPDGGAAGPRRGRPRRDRLQRRGRALRGGRRARRQRRRLRRLRAHHGPQAPHPRRRLHRRHLLLPAPRLPGDPLQVRRRRPRHRHAAPRRRRLLRLALHQLMVRPLPRRPHRRHAVHRPHPPPGARPAGPDPPAHRVPARARHAGLRGAAGPRRQAGVAAHGRGHLQAVPLRPRPPPRAAPHGRGRAAVQHVRGAGGARVAVRVPGARAGTGAAHQAVLRHGRAAAADADAPGGLLRQRHLHGHAARRGGQGDRLAGGRRDDHPGGAGEDGRRVLPLGARLPGAAAGPVGAGPRRAHVPVPQPRAHQLGAPAHPRRRLRLGPARVHGPRRHRLRGARLRAPQRQQRRQPVGGHLAAGRAHGEVPEDDL